MSILSTIKGWFSMLLKSRAKDEFNVVPITSAEVEWLIEYCARAYRGQPDWEDHENHIKTVNFSKSICSETARLTTLGISVHVDGGARGKWLQEQVDSFYFQLRECVEYGMAYGTVVLKPNGDTVKLYLPGQFEVTSKTGGKIDGMVFHNSAADEANGKYYTRLEYHRFEDGLYVITNKCYVGASQNSCTEQIDIKLTPWADLREESRILNVDRPLFGVLKTPHANNLDADSPLSLPIFSDALEELRDLDVAYSRNAKEIEDSKRTVLLDSDTLMPSGQRLSTAAGAIDAKKKAIGLPDYIKHVQGRGDTSLYHEINPTLNTDARLTGINALLSQIGYKIGFSNGYFVFNETTGIQTATGVEAEQQRTIQFIKDCRDKLESCLDDLIYAMSKIADLYGLAPVGAYEVIYDFGDITYNRDEDRARWWNYVQAGKVPAWMFFTKFEGMPEAEAKAMVQEAQPKTPTLFGGEE